ncbi:aldo/keto reductase [Actinophytocola oryzae]|uniref:Aryl-alcohol dehydrogenase-like predicted oxidoreductase n=1 Tax=Actinophytocola oryzae TaxID=502181 RepID=A0A4R7VFA5_9PSEU|nr:aldo/keto reductase [Actinophytocola oryzae]TDV47923.1 aryl-alcohol dehydrogenase-like predicted oxidoreductase [Actinophytocola oryzae]
MADQLRWGVVGPGRIARAFAGQLPNSRTGRLVAVGSRDQQRAAAFAAEFGGARAHGSYQAVLDDPEVDAVYVATPHSGHPEWVVRAARAGKHILCEKPLAITSAHAMAAVEAARRHDVFLMEAFMYRCHPQIRALADLVRDGVVGEVRHVQASFAFATASNPTGRLFAPELGGGGILDVGGYPVSAARLVAGAARGLPFVDPVAVTGAGHLGETGVDEWAIATLDFGDGLTAHVATGVRLTADNTIRVVGSEGFLEVADPWVPAPDVPGRVAVHRVGEEPREVTTEAIPQYAAEADAVADHLADRQAPQMSWADSLGNAAALDAWRAAIGLEYPVERNTPTVHGGPLRRGDRLPYGRLPGIDKPVSRLVMGVDNQRDLPHASVMFDDYVEQGGNTFDTAWLYGHGHHERLLGRWVANRGVRDDVVIIGKGCHTPHCDPESLHRQLGESLERLGTDHLDLYLMHRDNPEIPVGEFVDAMEQERAAGRVRAYGVSNWTLPRVTEASEYAAAHGVAGFAALSNHFSLAEAYAVPWQGCVHVTDAVSREWLRSHDLPLLPWSSQARGFFTGRAHPDDRSDEELVRCYYSDANFARLARAAELATSLGVPTTAVALAYVLHQPFPTFALIGPRTLAETHGSLRALDVTLTPEQVTWLEG